MVFLHCQFSVWLNLSLRVWPDFVYLPGQCWFSDSSGLVCLCGQSWFFCLVKLVLPAWSDFCLVRFWSTCLVRVVFSACFFLSFCLARVVFFLLGQILVFLPDQSCFFCLVRFCSSGLARVVFLFLPGQSCFFFCWVRFWSFCLTSSFFCLVRFWSSCLARVVFLLVFWGLFAWPELFFSAGLDFGLRVGFSAWSDFDLLAWPELGFPLGQILVFLPG